MRDSERLLTKRGGYLYITGKNIDYFDDDELALIAERNARRKGHPNYFTDVVKMKGLLLSLGMEIVSEEYELRRGDFGIPKIQYLIPDKFYEWRLYIRKAEAFNGGELPVFSDAYSNTWKRVGMAD